MTDRRRALLAYLVTRSVTLGAWKHYASLFTGEVD